MTEDNDKEQLDEMVDLYDAQGNPLNEKKELSQVHRDGDWHRTFHCWIVNPDIHGGSVLLQRRGEWKQNWPGKVDTSAAGHYDVGESLEDGGLRELREELGVEADVEDLIDAGTRIEVEEAEEGVKNYEFQDVRFLLSDKEIDDFDASYPEVGGLIYMPVSACLRLLSGESDVETGHGYSFVSQEDEDQPEKQYGDFKLTRDDFIPSIDRFYFKSAILAKRILNDEKHIQI
ncbi:NUDIX hydrolase [Halorubellus salinus]|uniref:NUDIX hydrolase n=1 Tax=Halorubellus salinus TaxID=755309 RepID=UPI001D05C452|nr:NUDIX domain-containing protein [Halorubellus salinus]